MSQPADDTNAVAVLVDISDISTISALSALAQDMVLLSRGELLSGRRDTSLCRSRLVALGPGTEQLLMLRHLVELTREPSSARFFVALDMSGDSPIDVDGFAQALDKAPRAEIVGVRMLGHVPCLLLAFGPSEVEVDSLLAALDRLSLTTPSAQADEHAVARFREAADSQRALAAHEAVVVELQASVTALERKTELLERDLKTKREKLQARRRRIQSLRSRVHELDSRLSALEQSPYVRLAERVEALERSLSRRLGRRRRVTLILGAAIATTILVAPALVAWLALGSAVAALVTTLLLVAALFMLAGVAALALKQLAGFSMLRREVRLHDGRQLRRHAQTRKQASRAESAARRRAGQATKETQELRAEVTGLLEDLSVSSDDALARLSERAEQLSSTLDGLSRTVASVSTGVDSLLAFSAQPLDLEELGLLAKFDDLAKADESLSNSLSHLGQQQVRLHRQSREHVEAASNLFSMFSPRAGLPAMGGWAASPDVLRFLVNELLEIKPACVVECGSGVSTVLLAMAIRQHDLPTRLVALEHDARFAEQTRSALMLQGVSETAEVRLAPLTQLSDLERDTAWYSPDALQDVSDVGLLFVDGPPGDTGSLVRWPAVPLLRDRFAERCTVVLDDLIRADEKQIAQEWESLLTDFSYELINFEKGAGVFRRRPR